MKFGFEQRWKSTVSEVVDLYVDEDFWRSLDHLSRTSPPEVLEVTRTGDTATTRLRYRLDVSLPKEASRFIDTDNVGWVEHTEWDIGAATATVAFEPNQGASLLKASAMVAVVADGDDVVRRVTGDLSVRIPILGRRVERAIVDGIGEHLGEEADSVADRLEG